MKLAEFFAARGIDPDRIVNASPLELHFFISACERYFSDEEAVIINAFSKIAEAKKG